MCCIKTTKSTEVLTLTDLDHEFAPGWVENLDWVQNSARNLHSRVALPGSIYIVSIG